MNPLKALKKEVAILHNYYKPEMKKIYNMIYPELPVDKFCQNESRFRWLKTYLCWETIYKFNIFLLKCSIHFYTISWSQKTNLRSGKISIRNLKFDYLPICICFCDWIPYFFFHYFSNSSQHIYSGHMGYSKFLKVWGPILAVLAKQKFYENVIYYLLIEVLE